MIQLSVSTRVVCFLHNRSITVTLGYLGITNWVPALKKTRQTTKKSQVLNEKETECLSFIYESGTTILEDRKRSRVEDFI